MSLRLTYGWRLLFSFSFLLFLSCSAKAQDQHVPRVLILIEGKTDIKSFPMGDGRQLATLLGHFTATTTIQGVEEYTSGSMSRYDQVFYIGYRAKNRVPQTFLHDVLTLQVPLVWLHTGFAEFSESNPEIQKKFGFTVTHLDSLGAYTRVESNGKVFTKDEPIINLIRITDRKKVEVIATAVSTKYQKQTPYIVRSGSLLYVADSPFASITPTDRYLLFADMLHDILHQQHEESHTAIIRIEDVTPMENPNKLRDIADLLSARGIPFLVGVVPFYVNPGEGVRISLSDKPEIVDALKYMVLNGGTIVMHGTTHQYKGITASDYEFWDESTNRPIKEETPEADARRIEMGLHEFMKNGLYPLAWETPHYTASFMFYRTIAKYFSTCIEQRLAIEDFDYSQYFPYVIEKDLFGQKIYPENLGYVPLDPDKAKSEEYVQSILRGAKANLAVRDGFATNFFHAFVDLSLLTEIVDNIQAMGYDYMDMRAETNSVTMKDRVILSGSQNYAISLHDQYLSEATFGDNGELISKSVSPTRLTGTIERSVTLEPGQFYKAEPTEYREKTRGFVENVVLKATSLYDKVFRDAKSWKELRPVILWNQTARGAAYNDQASFASMLHSVNIHADTLFVGQPLALAPYNLVIAPFSYIDSMKENDFDEIVRYVQSGGNLVTDTKNFLADELGFKFGSATLSVARPLDRFFPEERIVWRYPEPVVKFETDDVDEVFCVDNVTEAPLVVGKKLGKGKVIFVGTRFDPHSQQGYSHYPFFLEYMRRYFGAGPIVRRENLEMFFDPGYQKQSIENIIKIWVRNGVRRIHVAGWHQYPKYTYDYDRLIRLARANGILVYAWLEPPQVSQKFWLAHPEWREKNFKGEDVRPSWRYPVALTDDSCLAALVREYDSFLHAYDWDGVNIAELYFEAGRGFEQPNLWTPMHPSAIRDVRQHLGIDLRSIFSASSPEYWKTNQSVHDAVVKYRIDKLDHVYEKILPIVSSFAAERPGFQVIVTAMDSKGSPELRENIGVDMTRILALQKKYGFTLQVEDPEVLWSTDPRRYIAIGKQYEELLGNRDKLALDLNILSFRKPEQITPFPTLIPTGTEAFQIVHAAMRGAPRATIYAESSVNPQDYIFLASASATGIHYEPTSSGMTVDAASSFTLRLPSDVREIAVDEVHVTPIRDNLFLIPAGHHAITLSPDPTNELSGHKIEPRIMSITGNLLAASYGMRTIHFEYESDTRTLVSINLEPTAVNLDGQDLSLIPMKGNDCYTIVLPPGKHAVQLVAGGVFSFGINLTSFWSSTGIALFGTLGVALLLGMYLFRVALRRRVASSTK